MSDPFSSCRYSLAHAQRHITSLESVLDVFYESKPFKRVVEQVPESDYDLHKIRLEKALPEPLAGITFDTLNNLRSSLDQACYAIGIANGTKGKNSHFPFGDTPAEVESRRKTSSRDLPQSVFDLLAATKPYKNRNNFLWSLNKLCNSQKHEIVVPIPIATGGGTNHYSHFAGMVTQYFPPRWDPQLNEMVLAEVQRGTQYTYNMEIQTFVTFGKIETIMGKPLIPVLKTMAKEVEQILAGLQEKAHTLSIFNDMTERRPRQRNT